MSYDKKTLNIKKLKRKNNHFNYSVFNFIFSLTIISYFLLPEGFLLNKNKMTDLKSSTDVSIMSLKIFFWNLMHTVIILIGGIFGKKKSEEENYYSIGYWTFFVGVILAAITLGTGSFTASDIMSMSLSERILGMFNITKSAGLIEFFGLILIVSATAHKYLVMTDENETKTRKFKDLNWKKEELITLIIGFLLILIAAFIEGNTIVNL